MTISDINIIFDWIRMTFYWALQVDHRDHNDDYETALPSQYLVKVDKY